MRNSRFHSSLAALALPSRSVSLGLANVDLSPLPSPLSPSLPRGRKKCTLIGESSSNDILASSQRKKYRASPGVEKFDSKRFKRSIRSINETMVDRWTTSIDNHVSEGSRLRRGLDEGKLFPRIVTGISYRRGHNLPWWCIVTGHGRSVAVERPPRKKNDHRAP